MSTNDKLNLSQDEIADNERVWSGEELFRVTNPQLKAICDERGLEYESDANKRALVKTIMDAQIARQNADAAASVVIEENAAAIEGAVEGAAVAGVGTLALDARGGHAEAEFAGLDTMANEGGFPGSDVDEDSKEALTHKVVAEPAQPYKEKQPKKIDTLHGSIDSLGTIG